MLLLARLAHAEGLDRPSFLLFVMDTTRADAVSAYGQVARTTPAFDALAAAGLRYTRAYANAPWTLPSHASLFTGLLPHQHGVGWARTTAPDELVTLAERLRDAGYQTVGFAENAWISNAFNLNQGFEHFEMVGRLYPPLDATLAKWLPSRDAARPLFLFVNVVDPHAPYVVRDVNPHLPTGVSAERAAAVPQGDAHYMCQTGQLASELAILHGLYLGGVAVADAKLATTLAALGEAGLAERLVTIATSDHGEHFGENEFVGHVAGLHDALLRVPLVVHLPGDRAPATIETPVQLTAIPATVLALAGLPSPGAPFAPALPLTPSSGAPGSPIVAEWTDPHSTHTRDEQPFVGVHRLVSKKSRAACKPRHRAHGNMRTLIRYPHQLIAYEDFSPSLLDLRKPSAARSNLRRNKPKLAKTLLKALSATRTAPVIRAPAPPKQPPLPKEVEEQLRALGYLEAAP